MSDRFTVTSRDGVPISIQQSGAGPALLLVHGSSLNSTASWALVTPGLSQRFTVYAMDRRGRAPSGDVPSYSITNEANDVCAVIDAIGQPLTVLGHSYGALATLDALDRLHAVSRLILYEPPLMVKIGRAHV